MDAPRDRARAFALISLGVAALVIAAAALLFAISWRQHYGPCPELGHFDMTFPRTCYLTSR